MTKDKSILIKNIYYMLSYAFQSLRQSNYANIASEEFHNIEDLFARILSIGISQQLKLGLFREYITKNESLSVLRGKLNLNETIRNRIQRKQELFCEFDELSQNNLFNQILKTTAYYLIFTTGVKTEQKKALKNNLLFFDGIQKLEPAQIPWSKLHYQRNNKSYEMLMNICYFVLHGMLQTTDEGKYKMLEFSDEFMAKLYEKFILEYYKKHYKYLRPNAKEVYWDIPIDDDNPVVNSEPMIKFLPKMKTDIMLTCEGKTLIIDAKYYENTMQEHYDKSKIHSDNLYQIFTYVKNYDKDNTGNVAGLLLYAKTEDDIIKYPLKYKIGGNPIGASTLDLNKDFSEIASQLDQIVEEYFELKAKAV